MTTIKYRPAIDGLRALAVLSVCIFHLNHDWLPGGFVGVDIFFVISGYLITSILQTDCQNNCFSLKLFYQRRIARIFPAFFTVGLVTLVGAYYVYTPQDIASVGANLSTAALSIANMKYMLQGSYFAISPDAQPFLHYWSLSVEEQFYMGFPLLFMLVFMFARKHRALVLGCLCAVSFLSCVLMTQFRPVWAFYLLPTRAWELLAGCLLAVLSSFRCPTDAAGTRWLLLVSTSGLGLVALSLLLIREGSHFPGYWPLLPVTGTIAVLIPPAGNRCVSEKLLAVAPLVFIGRMSYSLYLWHWPIFSLVDYRLYLASESVRLALKISLSLLAAIISLQFIENPARSFLNRRKNLPLAYSLLIGGVIFCMLLGINVRKNNYVNAEASAVPKGGIVFNSRTNKCSVILMGDSNGSMYGKVLKDICSDLDYKLIVISVAAGDPLPSKDITHNILWLDSLSVVKKEKPDFLVLACAWESKLAKEKERLALAVDTLKPLVGRLVLLNQPPILPTNDNRASIRQGAHPPFYEVKKIHNSRLAINDYLNSFYKENVVVVNIASHFQMTDGSILIIDDQGRQLYQDGNHLSGFGGDLIRSEIVRAISVGVRYEALK